MGYTDNDNVSIVLSENNAFLKEEDNVVYSSDGTIMYYVNNHAGRYFIEIADGTKIINGKAFENCFFYSLPLTIPETVDSIGDRAFAGLLISVTSMVVIIVVI